MNEEKSKKSLLMISTDTLILKSDSDVRRRQIEYAKEWQAVHIIVFSRNDGNGKAKLALSDNCFVYPTASLFKILAVYDSWRIGKDICSSNKIDEMTCQDPFFTACVGLGLGKSFNLPVEIQIHGDIGSKHFGFNLANKIRKIMAFYLLPKASSVRVVSNKIKDWLANYYENKNISNIPITVRPIVVDKERIVNAPIKADLHQEFAQFSKIVLMASRIEKEKNIDLAIHAWNIVSRNLEDVGLVIVGVGSELPRLKKLVTKLSLEHSVIFLPWANQETLYSYYKTADAFLNTSWFEGYGMTLVEANYAGCKVISTDVGVAKEIGATIVDFEARDVAIKVMDFLRR